MAVTVEGNTRPRFSKPAAFFWQFRPNRADEKLQQRQAILQQAYAAHPERFVRGAPVVPTLPDAVWINQPKGATDQQANVLETSDLKPAYGEPRSVPSNGSDVFGRKANLDYTPTAGAEASQ